MPLGPALAVLQKRKAAAAGFPQIINTPAVQLFDGLTTTHNVVLPATIAAGDLLIAAFSWRANAGITCASPAGWTELYNVIAGAEVGGIVAVLDAAGTEDGTNANFLTSGNRVGAGIVWQISAASWHGTIATGIAATTPVATTSAAPNPASLAPGWGALDILWLATCHAGDEDFAVTVAPASYGTLIAGKTSGGAAAMTAIGAATRQLNAASEDPGAFTIAGSDSTLAATVAVRPA